MKNKILFVAVVGIVSVAVAAAVSFTAAAYTEVSPRTINIQHVENYNEAPASVSSEEDDVVGATYYDLQNFQAVNVYGAAAFSSTVSFSGALTLSAALTSTGDTSFTKAVVQGGSVTALTSVATSTLTAAQVCDSSLLTITPVTTTPTITFPSTSTLFTDCLTSNGQFVDVTYKSITTSTIIAAGTGGTLGFSSSATVAAGKTALLRVIRDSATTYLLELVNVLN